MATSADTVTTRSPAGIRPKAGERSAERLLGGERARIRLAEVRRDLGWRGARGAAGR